MLTQILLAAGMCAASAEPTAMITLHPVPEAFQQPAPLLQQNSLLEGPSADCASCGTWHGAGPYSWRCHFLFSPCNMPQHHDEWEADEAIKEKQRNIEMLPGTEGEAMMPEGSAEEGPGNDPAPQRPAEGAQEKAEEKPSPDGAKYAPRLKRLFTFGFSQP
jgi:hypothetical protein